MRSQPLLPVSARFALALLITVSLGSLSCQGSNTVSGSVNGTASPSAANVSGSWAGSFQPNDSGRCNGSSASATFQQNGAEVTGHLSTSQCGVSGYFRGTMQGDTLLGKIAMQGCVGGGVSGTVNGSRLSLSIGDLTKPLVTGDKPVMTGGIVSLGR